MSTKPNATNAAIVALTNQLEQLRNEYDELDGSLVDAERELDKAQLQATQCLETRDNVRNELKAIDEQSAQIKQALYVLKLLSKPKWATVFPSLNCPFPDGHNKDHICETGDPILNPMLIRNIPNQE